MVFTLLSTLLFKEDITLKTGVCLALSVSIVAIQLFWK
jgi:hypothetical protein